MKKIAILVIAATNQPVYIHYIRTHWSEIIRYTNTNTPHIDVFLLFEHDTDISEFQHLEGNIIQDPNADPGLLCPPDYHTRIIPGILGKTIHALELLQGRYDVFFRTNLSSFIDVPAFDRFVQCKNAIGYSGAFVWTDALRDDLLRHNRVGPGKSIKSLSELDEYPGNSFASGCGYFLNREEAQSLVSRKKQIRFDIIDDVSVGLMFDKCEVLSGFSLIVKPQEPPSQIVSRMKKSNAPHIRLEHFPLDKVGALWEELRIGGEERKMTQVQSGLQPQLPAFEKFKRAYASVRERRLRDLGKLLAGGARNNVVLVMMANRGYNDLLNNWIRSCDVNGIDVRSWAVLFAADEESAANADRMGFRTYLDPDSYGKQPREAVKVFGDADFRKLMFQKTAIVQDVLELGYDVLFQDVDMVWFKDPMDYFHRTELQEWDASFMYDGHNQFHAPLCANTGFFLLRNRMITIDFWTEVLASYEEMYKCGSQQAVVNSILRDNEIRVNILPEAHFANGHLFSTTGPSRLPLDPYVIHCSWTTNREHKLQKYIRHGLWYL